MSGRQRFPDLLHTIYLTAHGVMQSLFNALFYKQTEILPSDCSMGDNHAAVQQRLFHLV